MRVSSFRRTPQRLPPAVAMRSTGPQPTRLLVTGGHGQGREVVDAGGVALGLVGGERCVVPAPCPLVERVAAAEGAPQRRDIGRSSVVVSGMRIGSAIWAACRFVAR